MAREAEAAILRARVPSGSLSHLSGNRFAAPVIVRLADDVDGEDGEAGVLMELTMNYSLRSSIPHIVSTLWTIVGTEILL